MRHFKAACYNAATPTTLSASCDFHTHTL